MEKEKKLLENIYALYAVSSYLADSDGEILEQYGDHAPEDAVICDKNLFDRIRDACREPGCACIFREKPRFFYCAFHVEGRLLICGPMSRSFPAQEEILQYQKLHGIRKKEYSIPRVEERDICSALNLIRAMDGSINSEWNETGYLEPEKREEELYDYRYRKFRSSQEHLPYYMEKKWLEAIKTGNMEMLHEIVLTANPDDIGILAETEQKQVEYKTVTAVILSSRAAIEGGVDPVKAYEISDVLLQKIEKCRTIPQMEQIIDETILTFLRLVNDRQNTVSHDYIEQCKDYVSAHFQENIKVHTMAEYIGLDESYLGKLFKEREGMTIKEYIRREKMKVAANMLKYSDASIAEISDYLSFHSMSYFGEVFLKTYHMTPHNYRKAYKPVNFQK